MGKTALHVLAKRSTPDFVMRDKEREKRKKILKMCVQKLRDIDDPESVLCRAVLINNTFKTLKYTYRKVFRSDPEPETITITQQDQEEDEGVSSGTDNDSSGSEDEEDSVQASSSDNEADDEDTEEPGESYTTATIVVDKAGSGSSSPEAYCPDELTDQLNDPCCDIKDFNAESLIHSLMMPPLLSPQIEDMTNCSFYDAFSSENQTEAACHNNSEMSDTLNNTFSGAVDTSIKSEDLAASFKFAVVNNINSNPDQSVSTSVHSSYVSPPTSPSDLDFCQESNFQGVSCVQSDHMGNSILIDNLLTEIVQA